MNKGITKAQGEYCLFLNSGDTLLDKNILQKVFEDEPTEDILYGDLIFDYGINGRKTETLPDELTLPFLFQHNVWHPAAFIRRHLFDQFGNYNTGYRIAGDYEFFFRVLSSGNISTRHFPYPVALYDFEGISSDPANAEKIAGERSRVHSAYLNEFTIRQFQNRIRFKNKTLANIIADSKGLHRFVNCSYETAAALKRRLQGNDNSSRITFFTPTLWPTGSEIVILNLLHQLPGSVQATVISKYKGELAEKLPSFIKYRYFYPKPGGNFITKSFKLLRKLFYIPFLLRSNAQSLWYINTIALPEVLLYAERNKIKTIVHVHELEHMFTHLSAEDSKRVFSYPSLLIANSQLTAAFLKSSGVNQPMEIIYPAIDTSRSKRDVKEYTVMRTSLGIAPESFVWVMSGTIDENKNTLLFIDTAAEILKSKPSAVFMWLGKVTDPQYHSICMKRMQEAGISKSILWITPSHQDYWKYFNCADGFMLTSKAESFSVVTLEAMLLGLPVVSQDCGGVREVLGSEVGTIVGDQNNPFTMAESMLQYMNHEVKVDKDRMLEQAKGFDIAIWSHKWINVIQKAMR
jgi:glycosyltransferase involved in cell wall biosynthesis